MTESGKTGVRWRRVALVLLILGILILPGTAITEIYSPTLNLLTGRNVTFPVSINGTSNITGVSFTLVYNTSVIQVDSIVKNTTVFGSNSSITININNATGEADVVATNTDTGFPASFLSPLVDILIHSTGFPGTSPLNFTGPEYSFANFSVAPFDIITNGTVHILENPLPVAGFSATPLSGAKPLTVHFTDLTLTAPTAWNWSFGDGNFSTLQNPVHTYDFSGTFTVSLNATNASGSNLSVRTNYIVVNLPRPYANFTATPRSGTAPLPVSFTDQSLNNPTGWAWFFGDENYTAPWTQVNASAGWSARRGHSSVVMPDGSIVVMGGNDGSRKNDVWRSTNNGVTWTLVNASAGWTAREGHSSVAMPDGSIVLMGGDDGGKRNDVWRSSDNGATWTRVNASAGWTGRGWHSSVAMPDGSIILTGGDVSSDVFVNDTWRSMDNGATWTRMNASAGWMVRGYHSSVAMPDGSIVLTGGLAGTINMQDVWQSPDNGATWTQVNASAGWTGRRGHSSVVMPDASIVLIGGYDSIVGQKNDVWRSVNNGTTWTQVNASAGWTARLLQRSMVMPDGSIVLMGGFDLTSSNKNDVWRFNPTGSSAQNPSHTYTAPGTYPVALQAYNAGGYNSTLKTGYITVTGSVPTFTSITPNSGPTAGGTAVTITGTNFVSGGLFGVTIGGTPATGVNRTDATHITATTPAHAAGVVNVVITNNDGQNATGVNAYTYVAPPPLPVPLFTATPTTGQAPLPVSFTDLSLNSPTGWAWFFGDENYTAPWTLMNASSGWSGRVGQSSVAMSDGSIVLMGGFDGSFRKNDVWRSMDNGATWMRLNASSGWAARNAHSSVAMPDGSIVLMGGYDSGGYKNDTWRSTDSGATWTRVNASAGWAARDDQSSVSMPDGSIVLMGGYDGGWWKNDVWRSTDNGATWTQMTAGAGWAARNAHNSVAMSDGSIVLMGGHGAGGFYNDLWQSTDNGATWTQMTASAGWSARGYPSSAAMPDGSIVLMGGQDSGGSKNDTWRSTDNGATWMRLNASAGWSARSDPISVAMPDGSIVLMGGNDGAYKNDVWRFMPAGSTVRNPSHTYTAAGSYQVALQAYNAGGFNSTRKAAYITVLSAATTGPVHNLNSGLNYTTIQTAVENATAFDTILVDSGTYPENVIITGPLTLRGRDTGSGLPVVNPGSSGAIELDADTITLDGFVVRNAHDGIWVSGSDATIRNITATLNNYGIFLNSTQGTRITNATIMDNIYDGIVVSSSTSASMGYCHIYENGGPGVSVGEGSRNITIDHNTIENNLDPGIYLKQSYNTTISDNNLTTNYKGIFIEVSGSNTIVRNVISNNTWEGMYLDNAVRNTLTNNNVTGNHDNGIMLVNFSDYNILTGNRFVQNSNDGLYLDWSSNNTFTGDNASYNANRGFFLYESRNNTFTSVTAYQNTDGFSITEHSSSNTIRGLVSEFNTFTGGVDTASENTLVTGSSFGNGEYGVFVGSACNNTRFIGNIVENVTYDGIWLGEVSGCNVTGNTFRHGGVGISLSGTSSSSFINNTASDNNDYGIRIYDNSTWNTFSANNASGNGIAGVNFDGSFNSIFTNNRMDTNEYGALLSNDVNITFSANTINTSWEPAFELVMCRNITLAGNNIQGAGIWGTGAIRLSETRNTSILGNTIRNNYDIGVNVKDNSAGNLIAANSITGHTDAGIYAEYSNSNVFSGNFISENLHGLKLDSVLDSTLSGNVVRNNSYGITAVNSYGNTIYNNTFNNTQNAQDTGYNIWNTTKTAGANIIGGPYLGGNFWSDYTGVDFTGDGIGDTLIPYNSAGSVLSGGDRLPLTNHTGPPPPVANFTGTPTSGIVPLTVTFTDTSTGTPTSWNWSFGDGNVSVLQNPVHQYTSGGTFAVSLNVTNAGGSNVSAGLVQVRMRPFASFGWSPPEPEVNQSVTFDASASVDPDGYITTWDWSFGDGTNLLNQTTPFSYHTFTEPRVYNVTLTVIDNETFTGTTVNQVTVYAEKETITTALNGTTETTVGGVQSLVVNATTIGSTGGNVTTTNTSVTMTNTSEFWHNVEVRADTVNETSPGNITVQNVTEVVMQSAPITSALNATLGNVSVTLDVALRQYVQDAEIGVKVTQGANTTTMHGFQLAANTTGNDIREIAYTVELSNTGLINTNLTTNGTRALQKAIIAMSVSHAWVQTFDNGTNHEGRDEVKIIRIPESGTSAVLDTRFVRFDATTNLDLFEADSPDGLSLFGLLTLHAQAAAQSNQGTSPGGQTSGGTTGGGTGGGSTGGSGGYSSSSFFTNTAKMQESDEGKTLITNVISTGKEGILTVPIGTIVLGKDGKPLSTISVEMTPEADVPAVPLGAVYTFGGYAVTCSPDGATFKPAVSLRFSLTADEWNALLAKANDNTGHLTIKFSDAASGGWVNVPTTVDPGAHSLTGSVSHFSNYGVFIDTTAMTPVVIETTPAVPEVPTTSAPGTGTPAVKMPVTAMTTDIGLIAWLLGVAKDNPIVTVAVTAIAGGVAYFGIWKRRIKF